MSYTDAQVEALVEHLKKSNDMVLELMSHNVHTIDSRDPEEVGRHVSEMRNICGRLSLHLFRTYDMMHKFSQANWPKPTTPPSRPTVDDL
jgi:predicted metal-dependent phosphotriesterase family hydrolase